MMPHDVGSIDCFDSIIGEGKRATAGIAIAAVASRRREYTGIEKEHVEHRQVHFVVTLVDICELIQQTSPR